MGYGLVNGTDVSEKLVVKERFVLYPEYHHLK